MTKGFFDVSMDFAGQVTAEIHTQYILVLSAIVGIFVGFATKSVLNSFGCLAVGTGIALLLVVPAWPWYRRNPVKWLEPIVEAPKNESANETESEESKETTALSEKKDQ